MAATDDDAASGKDGRQDDPATNPGANPGDLATEKGEGNAKSRDVARDAPLDPEDVAGRMGSGGRGPGA